MTTAPLIRTAIGVVPRDARLTTIFLIGRMSNGVRDDLCRIRNISPGGMRIETLAPVDVGQNISVDLRNGATLRSKVVWLGEAEAGVRFDMPLDVKKVLAPGSRARRTKRVMRSPRLSTRCAVTLRCDGKTLPGVLTDVSQGGAQVQTEEITKLGDQIVLSIAGLPARRASIRWQYHGMVGLSFDETIGFADLSLWLAGPDRYALEPATAVTPIRRNF